jgi:hypothetical protein
MTNQREGADILVFGTLDGRRYEIPRAALEQYRAPEDERPQTTKLSGLIVELEQVSRSDVQQTYVGAEAAGGAGECPPGYSAIFTPFGTACLPTHPPGGESPIGLARPSEPPEHVCTSRDPPRPGSLPLIVARPARRNPGFCPAGLPCPRATRRPWLPVPALIVKVP